MGKMPLAGLIGACSLGMLLTGCNCFDKNKNKDQPSFAGGRMDSSMGFFKGGKGPDSKLISYDGVAGNSAIDSSDAVAAANSGTPQSGSSGSGSYTTDMAPPAGSGRMPSMGANMTSAGGLANLPSDSNAVGMTMSGAGSNANASPIRTVSQRMDDPSAVNAANYRPMDADTTPALPMRGPVVPPTPPTTDSSFAPYPNNKSSSSAAMGATNSISMVTPGSSAPLPPPTPPPSNSFGAASSNTGAGSLSSQPSAGSAAPTGSGSMSMPTYLSGR